MASSSISCILCYIETGNLWFSETDSRIFLGIGGREFRLDSSEDDYEAGSERTYILGDESKASSPWSNSIHVEKKEWNDPRVGVPLQIDDININRYPVYIRFEPRAFGDDWNIALVFVQVYNEDKQSVDIFFRDIPEGMWLGPSSGNILYLENGLRENFETWLERARQRTAERRKTAPDT